jgi:hypothetical protein
MGKHDESLPKDRMFKDLTTKRSERRRERERLRKMREINRNEDNERL